MSYFDNLPEELVVKILSFVPPLDIVRHVSAVCKRLHNTSLSDSFWHHKHVHTDELGNVTMQLAFLYNMRSIKSLGLRVDEALLSARLSVGSVEMLDIFDVMDLMPCLSVLDIDVCMNLTTINCNFRRERMCAAYKLKSLTIHDHDGIWFSSNAKISCIIEGCNDSLSIFRYLKDDCNSLHDDEMEALSLCNKLKCVKLPVLSLHCLNSQFISDVTLTVNGSDDVDSDSLCSSFLSIVKKNVMFRSVTKLCVLGDGDCVLGMLLNMFGKVFPNVVTLGIEGECWDSHGICFLLEQLKFLQSVAITSTGFRLSVLLCLLERNDIRAAGRLYLDLEEEHDPKVSLALATMRKRSTHFRSVYFYSKTEKKLMYS